MRQFYCLQVCEIQNAQLLTMNSFISRLAATGEQLKLLLMNFAFVSFFVFQIYDRIKSYAYTDISRPSRRCTATVVV